jgi:tetratricopeptide (TPR) repeat protein
MEYCRSRYEKQESVFWVNASNPARLEQSYGALANLISRNLHPGITFLDSEARIHYVKDTLRSLQRRWILVLDNYDDPSQFDNIRYYLPDSKLGSVITTSRHLDSTRLGVSVEVTGMAEDESLELLLRRSRHQRTEANEMLGKSIVRRLGYLPLAIDQAGSYMQWRKVRLGDFLDHYRQRRESVLQHTPLLWDYRKQLTDGDREARLSVFTTWDLSFEQLSSSKRLELMQLVSLFGFFYHESISEALFRNFGDHCGLEQVLQLDDANSETQGALGKSASWSWMKLFLNEAGEWSSINFGDALADLSELFLIENFERQDDGATRFSIHPLVSDWIKLRNKDDQTRRRYSEQVIGIMAVFLETNHFKYSPQTKEEILAHLDECLNHDKDFFKNNFRLGYQSLRAPAAAFAKFYCEQGRYQTAVELYQRVLDDETHYFGQGHVQTLETMHNLGCVFHSQGQYMQAKDMFRQALSGRETQLGDSHPQTLWTAESLANIFRSEARYIEAEQLYSRVLNGRLGQLQDDHPDILRAVANLANIHRSQGRYKSARVLYQQAAVLLEVQTCQIKCELSWIRNDIASFYQSQSQFIEAAQLYEAVLSSREELLGCSHPDTLWTVADLANNYRSQKRYREAEILYDRALDGLERQLGRDHPETLWTTDGLAHVYYCQDRFAEARVMFQRVLTGREIRLGPDHHNTLRTVHGLADVFHREGNFEESERLYNRALKGLEKQLGKDHPKTLAVVERLATNCLSQHKYEMAEALSIRALNGRLQCLGPSHADTLHTTDKLKSMYRDLGRDWNAQTLHD